MQSFSEWVSSVGGAERAADILGKSVKTIKSWVILYRHPSLESIQHIENTLGVGVIDFGAWRTRYLKKHDNYPDV